MKPDTQKTTKAVREAPAASEKVLCDGKGELWEIRRAPVTEDLYRAHIGVCPGCEHCQPRYTVELTTEGWQIKDNVKDHILIDQYASKAHAVHQAETLNRFERIDSAEGQGRR
jgi:hypothetical protein